LAVTTATRWQGLPDLPTVGDFLPGYEASAWAGVGAPKNTPPQILDKLNLMLASQTPSWRDALPTWAGAVLAGSPADFGKFISDEAEKWGKVIRAANIKAD